MLQKQKTMKIFHCIIIQFLSLNICAQIQESPEIADPFERAIQAFYKPIEEQDFSTAIALLEDLKTKDPENTEVRYFLGYAYDRFNCKDGKSIPDIQLEFTQLASEEFEFIINKAAKYNKRKLILDPYSKLTAIWGSLALKYYYDGNIDSTKFALKEGKKRGGFSEPILEIGEKILNACSQNSILFVSGDNFSFPIFYNQIIKNHRTDVQFLDISLLNTDWYGRLIQNTTSLSLLTDAIDFQNIPSYAESHKQLIKIPNKKCQKEVEFTWEIDNLRSGKYFLKGDSILKEIVVKNEFLHDIYFTLGQNPNDLLSLDKYLSNGLFVSQLGQCENGIEETADSIQFTSIANESVQNSGDILQMFDLFRYNYALEINQKLDRADFDTSRSLLNEMERIFPVKYIPIQNENLYLFIEELKRRL